MEALQLKNKQWVCKKCLNVVDEIPIRGVSSCMSCYLQDMKIKKRKTIFRIVKRILKI